MNRRDFTLAGAAALTATVSRTSAANSADQHGFQIAELTGDGLRLAHGGMAKYGTAVDDKTLFQVASCSKTVTGLAIFTLVRDDRVTLDHPVNGHLKRWQLRGPRGDRVTVAELLSHTAGTNIHGFPGYGVDDEIPDLIQILDGQPPANSPAVRTQRRLFRRLDYSGGGTTVLQCLIEDVTDVGFAQYVSAEVLNPIGANRATFDLRPHRAFAHGHQEGGQPVAGGFRRHPESAAAGLWATASDLVRIMCAILASLDGSHDALLPTSLAQRMITPMAPNVGLGVFVEPGEAISHDGRNEGFESAMAADLRTGRVRAAVTNRNGQMQGVLDTDHARYGPSGGE